MGRDGDGSDGGATSTKSYERILAEKESLRKSVQQGQQRIDELEEQVKLAQSTGTEHGRAADNGVIPWFKSKDELETTIRETVKTSNEEWWKGREEAQKKAQEEAAALQTQFLGWRKRAHEEITGAKDPASELSKMALTIFNDPANELSDGRGNPKTLRSEYDAYVQAKVQLERKANEQGDKGDAMKFAAGGGGGASGGVGAAKSTTEMDDAEWMKLSVEERRRLQNEEFERQNTMLRNK